MKVAAKGDARVELGGQLQQPLLPHPVDLVEREQQRRLAALQLAEDALDVLVDALGGVDHQQHLVGIAGAAPGRLHHGPVEAAARREDARRIDEDELARALDGDAAQRRARGLHLAADDGDLGAHQRVDERGLAGIGCADHGDEAAAGLARPCLGLGLASGSSRSQDDIGATLPHALAREQRGGGGLLGGALAGALATRGLAALDAHLGGEARGMVRPLAVDLHVGRQLQALALRPLLQQRFGVGGLRRRAADPARPSACARRRGPSRSRPPGRWRPAAPRRRRRGWSPCRGRRSRPPRRSAPGTARGRARAPPPRRCARAPAGCRAGPARLRWRWDRPPTAARRWRGPARGRPGTPAARCRGACPGLADAGVGQRLLQQVAAAEMVAEAGLQLLVFAGRRHDCRTDLTGRG